MADILSDPTGLPEPDSLGPDPEHPGVRFEVLLVRSQAQSMDKPVTQPRAGEAKRPRRRNGQSPEQRRAHAG